MIALPHYKDKTVAVLGLGKSGLAAARALMASGAHVLAWDDNPATRERAAAAGIPLHDLEGCDWCDIDSLVLSPGIPHRYPAPHPVASLARSKGCEIIGDIELLGQAEAEACFVGITGTNGKSTTTSLIGHILEGAGRPIQVGGNLGKPVLEFAALPQDGIYVLELSSYQLELTPSLVFDVALLLNISPDHLDRHGGFDGYIEAKKRIFQGQREAQTAILGRDDDTTRVIAETLKRDQHQAVVEVSGQEVVPGGVYCQGRRLIDDLEGAAVNVLDLGETTNLPGSHNAQNAAAAYAACRRLGLRSEQIVGALRSFPGLAHRQETLGLIDGIAYINDSKATNAEATGRALNCYDTIYWIIGGRAKETGLKGLEAFFPQIRHAFLIGEAEDSFAEALEGQVAYSRCGDLLSAVKAARTLAGNEAIPGAVVLLSPAAASFDQYANFEERGEDFRRIVESLQPEFSHQGLHREALQ